MPTYALVSAGLETNLPHNFTKPIKSVVSSCLWWHLNVQFYTKLGI